MLKKGQQLLDEHHVMRYVPWTKLRKDGDDNVVGFLPAAFELREVEDHLSVNWLEYYSGDHQNQVTQCIKEFRSGFEVKRKSAFGVANAGKVKEISQGNGKPVRIVYSPSDHNPSHTSIQKLPRDEFSLLEALASDAFTERIMNMEISF
jgi:hypothetical protein